MKHFMFNGVTTDELPGILYVGNDMVSPITEAIFVQLGGTITDDGELTPKEKVVASLNTLIEQLAPQVPQISIADFKAAASSLHSGELVGYAQQAGVSEEIINAARIRIVEILADAMREGMTWGELIDGITVPE